MKILEVCIAPGLGGLELYFHWCCLALRTRGHSLTSIRLAGSRLEELGKKDGVPTIALSKGNKIFPWKNAKQLARIIAENQIDIVHAHHKDNLPLLALTKWISKRPFRLVFTRQMPLAHVKKDPYHKWIYTKIDLMITITDLLKKDALEKLPISPDRIHRLYYGVPEPPARNDEFLKSFLSISEPGDFNIGVFSRLEFQKGQHMVIEALKKIRQKNIPARLYIVGHVMYEDYKTNLVQQVNDLQLQKDVVFKGFLEQPVLAMAGMNVLVLPSRNEAFGLVLIEAMRSGIAVMGVNAGGVPEIIDHEQTGLLFAWDNTDELADQLSYLYNNPSFRRNLALRGKEKADAQFNNDLHFQKLEDMFKRLSGKKLTVVNYRS